MLVWNEPKMDWQPPDGVSDEDFNRIETNIAILDQSQASINVKRYGAVGDGSVENESPAIQAALDAGAGKEIFIPDGEYKLQDRLFIRSGTRLRLGTNARMVRNSNSLDTLLLFWDGGEPTGYNGVSNILVEGGIWDVNGSSFPNECNGMAMAHAENIIVKDIKVYDIPEWHGLEINSSRNVKVLNCVFDGLTVTGDDRRSEMLQIDGAFSFEHFPFFGSFDNTMSRDVIIQGCTFKNSDDRALGSHAAVAGRRHENIRIVGNNFENLGNQAIRGYDWQNVSVSSNTIQNVGSGIECRAEENNLQGWSIVSNTINTTTSDIGHGIFFTQADTHQISNVSVIGNELIDCNDESFYGRYLYQTTISGNTIRNGSSDGILLRDAGNSVSIIGNTIHNPGKHGILIYQGLIRVNITGNTISSPAEHGIDIDNSSYCTVTGNIVYLAGTYGIFFTNSTHEGLINGNEVIGVSTGSDLIRLSDEVSNVHVVGNICRFGGSPAIYVTQTCSYCYVTSNYARSMDIVVNSATSREENNWSN